jgi:hypothetical protein
MKRTVPAAPVAFRQKAVAVLGVALVLALGVFGANPAWHTQLHECEHSADHRHNEGGAPVDNCAVELFAAGVETPVDAPCAPVVAPRGAEILRAAATVDVAAPEYRLLPSQAPPLG